MSGIKLPSAFPVTIKKGNSTVRIYRAENKGYDSFTVAYYVANKRKREHFSNYDDAKTRADAINTSVLNGDLATVVLSREDRLEYLRAKELLNGLNISLDLVARDHVEATKRLNGTPLLDAVDFYVKWNPKGLPLRRVEQVYQELLAAKEKDGASHVYRKDLKFRLSNFADTSTLLRPFIDSPTVRR